MLGIESALQIGGGIAGLLGGNRQNGARNDVLSMATKSAKKQGRLLDRVGAMVEAYDPVAAGRQAETHARDVAADAIEGGLKSNAARQANGGLLLANDTKGRGIVRDLAARVNDPLQGQVYEDARNAVPQKVAMLSQQIGMGQNFSDSLANLAQTMPQADTSGAQGLLAGGIDALLGGASKPAGRKPTAIEQIGANGVAKNFSKAFSGVHFR